MGILTVRRLLVGLALLVVFSSSLLAMDLKLDLRLAGTVDSVFQFDKAVFQERLIGDWADSSGGSTGVWLKVTRPDPSNDVYHVEFAGLENPCNGRLFRLSGRLVLDLVAETNTGTERMFFLPIHHYWGVQFEGDKLIFSFLSMQVGDDLRDGKLKCPHREFKELWLLTGTEEQNRLALRQALREIQGGDEHKTILIKK